MKKSLFLILAAVVLSSCSYHRIVIPHPTQLNFEMLDMGGNYVHIKVVPDNDYTIYLADVIEADEYEKTMLAMTEDEFQRSCIASSKEHYANWKKEWTGDTCKYLAGEIEHEFFSSQNQLYAIRLKPRTKYYVYGFCINPNSMEPLGTMQKMAFTTPSYNPFPDGVDFDFMIRDTKEAFYYYVRPSKDGRICFDGYFTTIFKDSEYKVEPYSGNIAAYTKNWINTLGDDIENYISIDISRFDNFQNLVEGEDYTIVAGPYLNIGNGPLILLHFKYRRGMTTPYKHDTVIEPN